MSLTRVTLAAALLVAPAARAQRPTGAPRHVAARADTIQHSPFIPGGHWRPGPPAPVPEPVTVAMAGAPVSTTDSAGYFARPNGLLLRPSGSVYQLSLSRDTTVIPLGTRTVTVSEVMLGGDSDWLVAESRIGTALPTADSLYLRRADLSPVRWTARNGTAQLAVSFTGDSMFSAVQDYQGRGSSAEGLPRGALVTPGMVDRLLELLPLGTGYHVNASVVVVDSGRPRSIPATISVEGEESVTLGPPPSPVQPSPTSLPATPPVISDQMVNCWLVVLRANGVEKRYWVAKSPQRVVKSEQRLASGLLTETLVP